jgi:hypothetical protein
MFDPYASLARLGLRFALLMRWLPPRLRARVLARRDAELARGLRFTLAHAGITAPALDDRALIAWVARTRPLAQAGDDAAARPQSERHAPNPDKSTSPGTRQGRVSGSHCHHARQWVPVMACGQTGKGVSLATAGKMPAAHAARAPPDASGAATSLSRR